MVSWATGRSMMLSVIVPASNEERLIGPCLEALIESAPPAGGAWQLVVVANGCRDNTASIARSYAPGARAKGVDLTVLDIALGNKLNAINAGEAVAGGSVTAYIDADVIVGDQLLAQLHQVLSHDRPAYGTGSLRVAQPQSTATRAYARFWQKLPFVTDSAPGCGVFAVNAAGRQRWGNFPQVISDDTFVRLHFTPDERHNVAARYEWPMVEGLANLIRVRRRQDIGVREIAELFPNLLKNEQKSRLGLAGIARLAISDPVGFMTYGLVALATRLPNSGPRWARGR